MPQLFSLFWRPSRHHKSETFGNVIWSTPPLLWLLLQNISSLFRGQSSTFIADEATEDGQCEAVAHFYCEFVEEESENGDLCEITNVTAIIGNAKSLPWQLCMSFCEWKLFHAIITIPLSNYRVQAKVLDIGDWNFFLEFKSTTRTYALRRLNIGSML